MWHRHDRFHYSLQWRHNQHDGVSNHQPRDCLLNRLFRRWSKKTSKLHVTGLCAGNSPVTGEFPTQMASKAENVSIRWRHHGDFLLTHLWLVRMTERLSLTTLRTLSHTRRRVPGSIPVVGSSCKRGIVHHYCDVIMGAMASQITSLIIVYSTVYSGADQRKHQSSASLAFVQGIHRWPVNPPYKWPVTRKMFPFDDVIMCTVQCRYNAVNFLQRSHNGHSIARPWGPGME